ncbi:glycosyl transferase family 2 [Antarcticibacterium sp. W02-3]|uniref:glycosyltransferase n=1 Tax=Antarcticibacterium sp. W02-3 TaxID=2183747 RepID=UPI0020430468|nr:glycosyltransferase [Antarcticibacterium sp. W02-3]MCM4161059.1 glycosyl transferase family 2 [Antarcticibacterium sp. W02-3]
MQLKYSFVVPVYNRPGEIRDLLQSMAALKFGRDYEVVIVEDGSSLPCREVLRDFESLINISYYFKPNSGPGRSRNFGMRKAAGNYFIILDSDVLLPPHYLQEVDTFLSSSYVDCYGGPDAAHDSFSVIQKAINYAMTSTLTTGGIRGKKKAVGKFQPRSFNMGISRKAFQASGGYGSIHPGEDPDLSLRLEKLGFKTALIPDAAVYHKRRIDWEKFYTQVRKFGKVRPILNLWHPGSGKITYWFPTVFIAGLAMALALLLLGWPLLIWLFFVYFLVIAIDATIKNKSLYIGFAAVVATFIQFYGYGTGFLQSIWKLYFMKMSPQAAFPNLFFNGKEEE